jgi:Uma2 family endonuclease
MTIVTTPDRGQPLTRADLAALPDDGRRYELVDGTLVMSPAPVIKHQIAVRNLLIALTRAAGSELVALGAPVDVVLSDRTVLQPDVLLARFGDLTERDLPAPPVLAVEVLSPSTRSVDRLLKYGRYAEAGVGHYWIFDPDELELIIFRLGTSGTYDEIARATREESLAIIEPVGLTLVPAALVTP